MLETLQKGLFEKIEKFKLFDNREQLTYVNKEPSDGEFKIIDAMVKAYLDNPKDARDITFDDMNTVVYCGTSKGTPIMA